MKIAIVSDIHGNLEALRVLPEEYDELWVLGDLVNYGPNPAEVIDIVRDKASLVIRGNHDHSVGTGEDPRCSSEFREMAEATGLYTDSVLSQEQKRYLGSLPITLQRTVDDCHFLLCHAVPSDPLFTYCRPNSRRWTEEVSGLSADIVLVGHTHLPCVLNIGRRKVVNPGSLGQPKHGAPQACYAVWEDGRVELRSFAYPVRETVRKVLSLPISGDLRRSLANVLLSGGSPRDDTQP